MFHKEVLYLSAETGKIIAQIFGSVTDVEEKKVFEKSGSKFLECIDEMALKIEMSDSDFVFNSTNFGMKVMRIDNGRKRRNAAQIENCLTPDRNSMSVNITYNMNI